MYQFSSKLKLVSIILLIAGAVLLAAGYFMNHSIDDARVEQMMEGISPAGHSTKLNSSEMVGPQDHAAHLDHAKMEGKKIAEIRDQGHKIYQ